MDGLQLQHPSLTDWDRITGNHEVNMAKGAARESASRILHVFEARQHVLKKVDPSNHKWKVNAPFEGQWQYSWGESRSQTDKNIKRFLPD